MTTDKKAPETPVEATSEQSFSAPLFDHDAQTWVETPVNEIPAKIASGKFTYQTGIKIPVVNAKGEVGEIDSDNAYNEFQHNGIRPLTLEDRRAFEERELDKINEANFGGRPVDAMIAGALRGSTLGLSDVVADQFGVGDAAAQVKERNPGASLAGEVVGTGAASLASGGLAPLSAGSRAAVGVGERLAAGAAKAGLSGTAAKVAASAAPAAVEGAYFGIGQGISEAALGNPDSVVDSLIGNVSAGALFGGGIGAAFGLGASAKPAFDKLVGNMVTGAGDAVQYAARKTGAKGLQAALNLKGEQKLAQQVDDYFNQSPEVRQFISQEGVDGLKQAERDLRPQVKEVREQLSGLRKDLGDALSTARDDVRQATEAIIQKTGSDIFAASQMSDDLARSAEQQFREGVASLTNVPSAFAAKGFGDAIGAVTAGLRSSGNPAAAKAASRLDALYSSHPLTTAADEATFLFKLQSSIKPLTKNLDDASRAQLDNFLTVTDGVLANYPNPVVSGLHKAYSAQSQAAETLKGVADRTIFRITKSPMAGEKVARAGADGAARIADDAKTLRTLINPQHREAINVALQSFDQLAPELKQWQQIAKIKDGTKRIAAQQAFQDAVESRIRQLAPGAKVDADEIETIFKMVGPVKNVDQAVARVREMQASLAPSESVMTRTMAIMKALNKDISPQLQRLAQYEKQIRFVQDLQKVDVPGVSPGKLALGVSLGDFAGIIFGLNKTSANRYVDAIQAVEAVAAKGARTLNKAIGNTTAALTGKMATKAAKAVGNAVDKGPTMKEQRARYPELKTALNAPISPITSAELMPQVSQAIAAKHQQIQDFLRSKLPVDPFEEVSLSVNDTGYMPSDQELSSFYRYVNAVDNPMKVLASLESGTPSPEEVETLKVIYPQVYKTLQDSVLDAIITNRATLNYKQKLTLGELFDLPTDASLQPNFIARMQASINKDEGGRPEGTGGNRKITLDLKPSETVATSAQQITYS